MRQVDQALRQTGSTIERPGPAEWRLQLPGLPGGSAKGRADDGWLRLTAKPDGVLLDEWELLRLNPRLPGSVRCALDPRTHRPMVCADVSLEEEVPFTIRIREACEGLVAAEEVVNRWDATPLEAGRATGAQDSPENARTTAQLFEECGWPTSERDGRLVVQIGVSPSESSFATVQSRLDGGGLSVDSTLATEGDSDAVRRAVARCVLAVTGVVRGVRASVRFTSGKASIGLETGFDSQPCAPEVRSRLAALSIARTRCVREVRALHDPRVAEAYLALFTTRCAHGGVLPVAV